MNYDNPLLSARLNRIFRKILDQVTSNPRTSIAGAVVIASALFPKYAATIASIATGIGFFLTKDGNKGSSAPSEVADAVVNRATDACGVTISAPVTVESVTEPK